MYRTARADHAANLRADRVPSGWAIADTASPVVVNFAPDTRTPAQREADRTAIRGILVGTVSLEVR